MAGWIISAIAAALALLLCIAAINAAAKRPAKRKRLPVRDKPDAEAAANRLAGALRFRTISYFDRSQMDMAEFDRLHEYLQASYPLVHQALTREVTDMRSLIYKWQGSDDSLEPIALLAHQDVVPVNEEKWTVPPFEGRVTDGYVYGRGALDMKGQLIAVLESIEALIGKGFKPRRSVYLLFGSDEEPMGEYGARKVSELLESRGVRFHYVFDEGGAMQDGRMMGVEGDIALIGICEKGIMNLRLTAVSKSGHASMPPAHTAVGKLADAVHALEERQMKPAFNYAVNNMFRALVPHMNKIYKLLFANRWLFGGLLKKILVKIPASAALLRTTFAPTQLAGSNAPNVLAGEASAVFNIRIAPGQTDRDVLDHIDAHTEDMEREVIYYYPPSPVSSVDSDAFRDVKAAVADAFPEMAVAPFLMIAATDSRHYYNICDNVFRFVPFPSIKEDLGGVHGEDERISIESLGRGIGFYMHLIRTTC